MVPVSTMIIVGSKQGKPSLGGSSVSGEAQSWGKPSLGGSGKLSLGGSGKLSLGGSPVSREASLEGSPVSGEAQSQGKLSPGGSYNGMEKIIDTTIAIGECTCTSRTWTRKRGYSR